MQAIPPNLLEPAHLHHGVIDLLEVVVMAMADDTGKTDLNKRDIFVEKLDAYDGLRLVRLLVEIKANGQFWPSTTHLGFIETDKQTAENNGLSKENIKQFMDEAWLNCVHTPAENIDALMKETPIHWDHATQWTPDLGVEELVQRIAPVHYLLDNIMLCLTSNAPTPKY